MNTTRAPRIWMLILVALPLAGCGSNSGVVRAGQVSVSNSDGVQIKQEIYKIDKRAGTSLISSESVKSDVMLQASKFCTTSGKQLHVVNVIMGSPPYLYGNFPKAEVYFKCLDAEEIAQVRAAEKIDTDASKNGAPVQDQNDIDAELEKLKGLLDEGIITQAEFDAKKNQILAK